MLPGVAEQQTQDQTITTGLGRFFLQLLQMAVNQDVYAMDFGTPLLFTLPSEQPADFRTPRPVHSPLRESGTISSARRSATPPGSVHTDTTPPRPPPILRLQDTLMTGALTASCHRACHSFTPPTCNCWSCLTRCDVGNQCPCAIALERSRGMSSISSSRADSSGAVIADQASTGCCFSRARPATG